MVVARMALKASKKMTARRATATPRNTRRATNPKATMQKKNASGLKRGLTDKKKAVTSFKKDKWFSNTGGGGAKNSDKWYEKNQKYWERVDTSVRAVTGGGVHRKDVPFSLEFVRSLRKTAVGKKCAFGTALDVGSGIGRVSKAVLLNIVDKRVDLLEPARPLLAKAKKDLSSRSNIGEFYCKNVVDFKPGRSRYDLVWCQWVLMYIPDPDLVKVLKRLRNSLRPGGIVIVKENVPDDGDKESYVERDTRGTDANELVRMPRHMEALFSQAGFKIIKKRKQRCPKDDEFRLQMYALTT